MKKITVYSDGACDGNPGPGGWAAVLQYGERCREIAGYTIATTNNRMELQAAIEALQVLKEPCQIDFYTDSEYLRDGITSWIDTWKRKGWRTAERKPVKNADLWKQLDSVRTSHQISWHWVKGHAGNPWNERCDLLATEQIRFLRQKLKPEELSQALADFKARHSAYPTPPSSHTGTQPTSPQNLELSFE